MKKIIVPIIASLFLISCLDRHTVKGNGVMKTVNNNISGFSSVDVSGNFDVYLSQDSSVGVRLETDENLIDYIDIFKDDETLVIRPKNHANLNSSKEIKVFVSASKFNDLEASGSCVYKSRGTIATNLLRIKLSGACDVDMDVDAPKIETSLSGAGSIRLRGKTRDFSVDGSGATTVRCMDLLAENVDVEISGSGNAEVFASVKLDVHVSGAGDVRYKGNAVVNKQISGAGSVRKVD